jgi:hypothetical protein
MIQKLVTEIGGIANFGTISICLFILVFVGALVWAAVQKKTFLNSMSVLPLEDGTTDSVVKGGTRHG